MPAKGSTGTVRRAPLRSDRGVKLYAPTDAKPIFRVVARGQVERTSATVPVELLAASAKVKFESTHLDAITARARREADEIFDQMVAWAKHQPVAVRRGERTMNALCDRRLQELKDQERALTTWDQNESLMRLYVRPVIGRIEVADWNPEHSRTVLRTASETCGRERIADLRKVLRCLVTLAHQKPAWLSRDEDPMEGVEFRLKPTSQSESIHYVPVSERPSTDQVESLARSMGEVGKRTAAYLGARPNKPASVDRDYGWLLVQTAGKCGPRFGEAIALTVTSVAPLRTTIEHAIEHDLKLSDRDRTNRRAGIIDLPHGHAIDPENRLIWITESVEWDGSKPHVAPGEVRASGKSPKSEKDRWTIYPESLIEPFVTRCTELLERFGPDQGPHALLFPARDHAFAYVPIDSRRPNGARRWQDQDWWSRSDFPRSMYKKAVANAESWPETPPFPFENLRHHFATWAKRYDYSDVLISHCMGHATVDYTQKRYFRTGADTISQGMTASSNL
jgi:integrase